MNYFQDLVRRYKVDENNHCREDFALFKNKEFPISDIRRKHELATILESIKGNGKGSAASYIKFYFFLEKYTENKMRRTELKAACEIADKSNYMIAKIKTISNRVQLFLSRCRKGTYKCVSVD